MAYSPFRLCLSHQAIKGLTQQSVRRLHWLKLAEKLRPPSKLQRHISPRINVQSDLLRTLPALLVKSNRCFSSEHSGEKSIEQSPSKLVELELATLCTDIRKSLCISENELQDISQYHFDGEGKAFRPMIVLLMAKACNHHVMQDSATLDSQRTIAMIAEMIHTASLIHDDVIDVSTMRRGRDSVQAAWGQRKAILAGDYIISVATGLLAHIRNAEVVEVLSQVLEDLVRGEFMQLGSKEDETERFNHYLSKTFKKTASLIAHSCKAVAILSKGTEPMINTAYEYGRNVGIAFQLVDDLLDFTSSEQLMGKPTAADLRLGLATAPVLFAAQKHPELNALIMRRFSKQGDVEEARRLVALSDGVEQTRYLAKQHCREAIRFVSNMAACDERDALVAVTHRVLNRLR